MIVGHRSKSIDVREVEMLCDRKQEVIGHILKRLQARTWRRLLDARAWYRISHVKVVVPLLAADSSRDSVSWLGVPFAFPGNWNFSGFSQSRRALRCSPRCMRSSFFVPTPFKYLSFAPGDPQKRAPEEVLKPGALYAECAAPLRISTTLAPSA